MPFIRKYALLLLLTLAPSPAPAQGAPDPLQLADSLRKEIDAASLAGSRPRIDAARRLLERAITLFPKDGLLLHYKAYTMYRSLQIRSEELPADTKASLLDEAIRTFDESGKLTPLAESHALRWSLLGQSITDAGSAMAVMSTMQGELAQALRLGKDNPRVWLLQGQSAFFTPAQWGGGAGAALEHLTKAESLFKTDHPAKGMPDWGRAEVYAWLGIVHQKLGHADESRKAYQEALRIAPGYLWVKEELLPGLERGAQPFPEVP